MTIQYIYYNEFIIVNLFSQNSERFYDLNSDDCSALSGKSRTRFKNIASIGIIIDDCYQSYGSLS